MAALFVIAGAIPPALASKQNRLPKPSGSTPLWPFVVVLALGAVMAVTISVTGYRTPALPPSGSAASGSFAAGPPVRVA